MEVVCWLQMVWWSASRCSAVVVIHSQRCCNHHPLHPNSYCTLDEEGRDGGSGEVTRLAGRQREEGREHTSSCYQCLQQTEIPMLAAAWSMLTVDWLMLKAD